MPDTPIQPGSEPVAADGQARASRTPWRHGVALWFLIMAFESVNGTLRELVLKPWLGADVAERVGFATAASVILAIAWIFAQWLQAPSRRAQLRIGALWAALTLSFEAALARTIGLSLDDFLADYDPSRGGLMGFGLLLLLVAPMLGTALHAAGQRGHPPPA